MSKIFKVKIKVDGDTKEVKLTKQEFQNLETQVKKTDNSTIAFQNRLRDMAHATVSIYTITKSFQALVNVTTSLNQTSGEFEKYKNILGTLEHSGAKAEKSFEWIKKFTTNTPYELSQVTQSFIKLKAYGIDATDGILKTLGDTASAMGKDLNSAVEAVADAMTGENERLKEFGIKAKLKGNEITYNWVNSSGEIKTKTIQNNQKIIKSTLETIWNEKYNGAMINMMSTYEGMLSNLSDNWTNTKDKIARDSGIFDNTKQALSLINKELKDMTDTDFQVFTDGAKVGFNMLVDGSMAVIEGIGYVGYSFYSIGTGIEQLGLRAYSSFEHIKMYALEMYKYIIDKYNLIATFTPGLEPIDTTDIEKDILKSKQKILNYTVDYQKVELQNYELGESINKTLEKMREIKNKIQDSEIITKKDIDNMTSIDNKFRSFNTPDPISLTFEITDAESERLDKEIEDMVDEVAISTDFSFSPQTEQLSNITNEWTKALAFYPNKTDEVNKYYLKQYEAINDDKIKADKKASIDYGSAISNAIIMGINGSNLEEIMGSLSTSMGSSMLNAGVSSYAMGSGNMGMLGAGVAFSAIGGLMNKDSISAQERATNMLNAFTDELTYATKNLTALGSVGSTKVEELSTTESEIDKLTARLEIMTMKGDLGSSFTSYENQGTYTLGQDLTDALALADFDKVTHLEDLEAWNIELKQLTEDYADIVMTTLGDSIDYSKLSIDELNNLVSKDAIAEYEILNDRLQEIALETKANNGVLEDNTEVISILNNENYKLVSDYKEAIPILEEYNETSKENIQTYKDSFKTQEELLQDMAKSFDFSSYAKSYSELDDMFVKLSTDTDGLTDAEMDLLDANRDYIDALRYEEELKEELVLKNYTLQYEAYELAKQTFEDISDTLDDMADSFSKSAVDIIRDINGLVYTDDQNLDALIMSYNSYKDQYDVALQTATDDPTVDNIDYLNQTYSQLTTLAQDITKAGEDGDFDDERLERLLNPIKDDFFDLLSYTDPTVYAIEKLTDVLVKYTDDFNNVDFATDYELVRGADDTYYRLQDIIGIDTQSAQYLGDLTEASLSYYATGSIGDAQTTYDVTQAVNTSQTADDYAAVTGQVAPTLDQWQSFATTGATDTQVLTKFASEYGDKDGTIDSADEAEQIESAMELYLLAMREAGLYDDIANITNVQNILDRDLVETFYEDKLRENVKDWVYADRYIADFGTLGKDILAMERDNPTGKTSGFTSVNDIFINVLGREPATQSGIDYWNSKHDSGTSWDDIASIVSKSDEALALGFTPFKLGGFTSGGINDIAGVVHGGEYVAPAYQVNQNPQLFRQLDNARTGYKAGGFVNNDFSTSDDKTIKILQNIEKKLDEQNRLTNSLLKTSNKNRIETKIRGRKKDTLDIQATA